MSKQSELNSYIAQLLLRLRLRTWLVGAALWAGSALVVTIALVLLLNRYAFPSAGIQGARLALFVTLATVAAFGIVVPLVRLTSMRAIRKAEAAHAEFEQGLTTFHERQSEEPNPFLELLAADTLTRAQEAPPSSLAPPRLLYAVSGIGVGCLAVLIWMITAQSGFLGYGSALLWTGAKSNTAPLYSIVVTPGDVTVRRNSDQAITAHIIGLRPDKVQMFAHYKTANAWEPVTMQTQPDTGGGASYQFILAGLPEDVEYYVVAGPLVSQHYKVRVVDLPSVKKIQVTYQFPKWTGLKPGIQDQTGDLRAIEGTDAVVEVEMDKPLIDGKLSLDDNKTITLSGGAANKYKGTIHMEKDGAYHVAAIEQGQPVRLSEDYFIATDKAEPPQISITHPGGDYRASPIEEVTIGVEAADQFGIKDLRLHYSVNGGPDRDIDLLKSPGMKSTKGSHTIRLEDFKLVPGDLVSLYATARDGHSDARTNISFVQVDPFEREFSQSQQGGGGGGSGNSGGQSNQTDLSRREKEVIAATWKQQNDRTSSPKAAAVAGQFLSDAQQKLRDQVTALSARMQSRDLSEANEEFTGFEKDMQLAAEAMAPSADKLKNMQWKDALPLEQKALQALLRAEATFRQIQVAFGQQGGGGGGSNSAGRDLASLFDLELDTEKNQYETAQNTSPAEQQQKEIEDVLAKLDALTKRQEELSKQQSNSQQSFQDRWQQEMLRREAEQLQHQMEQLAQNGQAQKSGGSSQAKGSTSGEGSSSQSSSKQQNSSGESASQTESKSQDQRIEQALSRLRQAGDAMKRNGSSQQSSDAARQAADRLQDAKNLLGASQQQLASGKLGSLSQEADRIAQEERAQVDRINKFASQHDDVDTTDRDSMTARLRERNQLAGERQQLSNDLSKLQKDIRDSARSMAPNQPETAQKLRDALTQMDESDLDNHMQRTADWLRRGINPNSNGAESQIADDLQKLSQQLREAQKGIGQSAPGKRIGNAPGDQTAALEQLKRLRGQLEAMTGSRSGRRGAKDQSNQEAVASGEGTRNQSQPRNQGGRNGQTASSSSAQNGQQRGGSGQQKENGTGQTGNADGEIRRGGGGYSDGTAWNNINTGNNSYTPGIGRPAPGDASGNPRDSEQTYRQQMRELNQLGQMVQSDPNASKEVRDLTRQMQTLDPGRFPGNPEIVEQMHREMLNSIDRIELQLRRTDSLSEARTGKTDTVPPGYQDSVAEYYRRLSNTH